MHTFLELNRYLHIVFGFAALAAFWVPVFSKKGGKVHRSAGKVFRYAAMLVLGAAGLAVIVPTTLQLLDDPNNIALYPERWAFVVFLGYLALVTGVILSHGIAVLNSKSDLSKLNTPYRRISAWSAIFASLFIIGWAIYWQPENAILLYVLSPLGIVNGWGILKVISPKASNEPRKWLLEHLNALLSCGIAFHTAFAVFGMNRVLPFELPGVWSVIPWILPAAIGIPAAIILTRTYQNKAASAMPQQRA